MRAQATRLGLRYERVAAVDGVQDVPRWMRDEFDFNAGLSSGEIGCYASHLKICAEIIEQKIDAAIVLEDDVTLDEDFLECSAKAIERAPDGWDIIHLSTNFKKPAVPIRSLDSIRSLVRYARMPVNSAAYAISASGAAKLLAPGRRNRPFDMEFRYAWTRGLDICGVYPPVARQCGEFISTIRQPSPEDDPAGMLSKKTPRPKWKPGLKTQIHGWFYVQRRLGLNGMSHLLARLAARVKSSTHR